jgi:Protein of unknown function (DUF4013)
MSAQPEPWKVMCQSGLFETDLGTLQQWIMDGVVLAEDRVSKGNMRWIEAYKAPPLRPLFDKSGGTVFDGMVPEEQVAQTPAVEAPTRTLAPEPVETPEAVETSRREAGPDPSNSCHFHSDIAPEYVCRICSGLFCGGCIKMVGTGSVSLCPLCGDLCSRVQEGQQKIVNDRIQTSGFGLSDFSQSIAYPFRHLVALLFGAVAYGFLLLGGFKTTVIAWAVLFGCIAHAINHVAVGRMHRSFLPDFSAFDLWDDLIKPAFLGLGITLVTLGPAIVLVCFLVWSMFGGPAPTKPNLANTQSKMLTSQDFNELIESRDEKKSQELAAKIKALSPGQQIADQVRTMDEQPSPLSMTLNLTQTPIWLVIGIGLSIIWAIFYFPMALAVAGYTEDFKSTINPLIGFDTMRRMGGTYVKAFLMYLVIGGVGAGVMLLVNTITAALNMPLIGNLPAKFLNGTVTFYFNMVLACLMGLALFKSADRVGIATD